MQFSKEDNNRLPSGNPPYILRENGDVLDEVQGGVKDDPLTFQAARTMVSFTEI